MTFRFPEIDSPLQRLCTAALAIGLATLVASTTQAGPAPNYCEIDIKCSVGSYAPDDYACAVVPADNVTFYYDFIGGEAEITDDHFGVIGIYTGTTLTRTMWHDESTTHTATFRPINTVCTTGIFSDSVHVIHGAPTPTATPTATPATTPTPTPTSTPTATLTATPTATLTATPTATPTAPPTSCDVTWPLRSITTIAKGQSLTNNAKVSHLIRAHVVGDICLNGGACTASRIPVCAGTDVTIAVSDTTGGATNSNIGKGGIACGAAGCSVASITVTEKYKSVSADGKDTDRVTLLPK